MNLMIVYSFSLSCVNEIRKNCTLNVLVVLQLMWLEVLQNCYCLVIEIQLIFLLTVNGHAQRLACCVCLCVSGLYYSNKMTFDQDIWHAGSPQH